MADKCLDQIFQRFLIDKINLFFCNFIDTAWNNDNQVMRSIDKHIDILIDYLNLDNLGKILAKGYGYVGARLEDEYKREAYELGMSVR